MSFKRVSPKWPRDITERVENIERMLSGKPFWSIAPIVLPGFVDVETVMASEQATRQIDYHFSRTTPEPYHLIPRQYRQYDSFYDLFGGGFRRFFAMSSRLGCMPDSDQVRLGVFKSDYKRDVAVAHVDALISGYKGTSAVISETSDPSTLSYEGPMKLSQGVRHLSEVDGKPERYYFVPLDEQEPTPVEAGCAAIFDHTSVHFEPPASGEMRFFARSHYAGIAQDYTAMQMIARELQRTESQV